MVGANDGQTGNPGLTLTDANLRKYSSTMPRKQSFGGTRSFATEKHSMKSYMSSLSSMSNFFRVTDSPYGGVIPSSVLRQAMEKRQEQLRQEGAVKGRDAQQQVPEQTQQDVMNTSAGQQGSAGDTTQTNIQP